MRIRTATGRVFRPEDFIEELEGRVADGEVSPEVAMLNVTTTLPGLSAELYREQRERFLEIDGMRERGEFRRDAA